MEKNKKKQEELRMKNLASLQRAKENDNKKTEERAK